MFGKSEFIKTKIESLEVDGDERNNEDVSKRVLEEYGVYHGKKVLFIVVTVVLIFVTCVLCIRMGSTDLSYGDILHSLFLKGDSWNDTVVWDLRMPRLVAAIICGATLAMAGCVMQSVLRNPLASPFTLGISNAAAFGAALAILVASTPASFQSLVTIADMSSPYAVTASAFLFSMLSVVIILLLVKVTSGAPETIVLAGVALGSIFSAILSMMQYIADESTLSAIVYWQFGNLDKVGWNELATMAAVCIPSFLIFYYLRWSLNSMEAGEDVARSLGVNIHRTRLFCITLCAVVVSVIVAHVGIIGFVGLMGPHIVKRFIGNDSRYALPASMVVGALFLIVCNTFGLFAFDSVIPVGIITSALGGPAFLVILIWRYRENAASKKCRFRLREPRDPERRQFRYPGP